MPLTFTICWARPGSDAGDDVADQCRCRLLVPLAIQSSKPVVSSSAEKWSVAADVDRTGSATGAGPAGDGCCGPGGAGAVPSVFQSSKPWPSLRRFKEERAAEVEGRSSGRQRAVGSGAQCPREELVPLTVPSDWSRVRSRWHCRRWLRKRACRSVGEARCGSTSRVGCP